MFQFIREYVRRKLWDQRARQLFAVKQGMVQLRAMLREAEAKGEVVKTDSVRQFVHQIGHHIMSLEHHIDGMLEDTPAPQQAERPA